MKGRPAAVLPMVTVLLLLVLASTGCTAPGSVSTSTTPTTSSTSSSVVPPEPAVFRRGCNSAVSGTLPPAWRDVSVIVGPIAFVWLAGGGSLSSRDLGSSERGYRALKVLVALKQGRQETVSIQRSERSKVSLLYDPSTFAATGRYAFDQGSAAVHFSACPGRARSWSAATQFNGGFIARGPVCLRLIVRDASGIATRSSLVPIARGSSCPSSTL
jgi:hypothetical protein